MKSKLIYVSEFVSLLNPDEEMLGPIGNDSTIITTTPPACWGPMITPNMPSGHEVTKPVALENANIGDAVMITVQKITIRSRATTSGVDEAVPKRYKDDPYIAPLCPHCKKEWPESYIEGIGENSIKCSNCNSAIIPFSMLHGYTMFIDEEIGVTVPPAVAKIIASNAESFMAIPKKSKQYPACILNKSDLAGTISRVKPMIGNIGTLPGITMPSSHNAGDFGSFLVGSSHRYSITEKELQMRTDGHMDINIVTEGASIICPVKVKGAGIYVGDVHAMQGDGEIAGHTTDVSAEVILNIKLLKNCNIDGPILLPEISDIPYLSRPITGGERENAKKVCEKLKIELEENVLPVVVVGSGSNINNAVINALERIVKITELNLNEVKNRATIMGSIRIGRLPGVAYISVLVPQSTLKKKGLLEIIKNMYS